MENTFSIAHVGVILCAVCGFYFFLVFCFHSLLHKKKCLSFSISTTPLLKYCIRQNFKDNFLYAIAYCIYVLCIAYNILFYDFSFSIYCSLRIASNVDSIVATYLCLTMCFELHSMLSINA